MEAHEGVGERIVVFAPDLRLPHARGDGVVDVQQRHGVGGDAGADVLAQRAVDVHLAAHGDAAGGKARVYITRLKAELLGEGGPALIGKGYVLAGALVRFRPVEQGQLKLRHALKHIGEVTAVAHLSSHVSTDLGDALVSGVGLVAHQQVKLEVLFDFHAQLI